MAPSSARSLGTSMSAVSAEPPNARRSMSTTTWLATPAAARDSRGGLELDLVALAVAEAERVDGEALALGDREHGGRVEAAAQQHHRRPATHKTSPTRLSSATNLSMHKRCLTPFCWKPAVVCPRGSRLRSGQRPRRRLRWRSFGAGRPARRSRTSRCPASAIPLPVVHWLGRIKGAAARVNAELGLLDADAGRADRRRRRRGRGRRARRPVPDRRLPDRLGHLVEHERQRGDREPRRRRRPPQRPRQHGPVAPTTCSRRPSTLAALDRIVDELLPALDAAGRRARRQGRGVRRRGQGRAAPT